MKGNKKNIVTIFLIIFIIISISASCMAFCKFKKCKVVSNNIYSNAFYGLIGNMEDIEDYLTKSLITTDSKESSKTLIYIWDNANLAQAYLAQIPINTKNLSNTQKFLNQISEYTYTLSRKCLRGEDLSQDEIENLKELLKYSSELNNILSQIMSEIESRTISWEELDESGSSILQKEIENGTMDSFDSIESNFEKYDGLIYDGAYSEHITNIEKKGLTGEEITEDKAKTIAENVISFKKIQNIESKGLSENGTIQVYTFEILIESEETITIAITKKGGHVLFMNYNREIGEEIISIDEADLKATDFLSANGFTNMEKTYYIIESGIATINYAYEEDEVIVYPDLIKVKVSLDNGEILGIETTGYINNHEKRNINKNNIISIQTALKMVNKELAIENTRLAIIPTEYKTEIFCWELKGKIEDKQFLLYVNAKTGEVEDVLIIIDTGNGILTQ